MSKALSRGQVEHEGRQQLAQTLLRTGPLTAAGLASEAGRPVAEIEYHLKVLARARAVDLRWGGRIRKDEIVYSLSLPRLPGWACKALLGEFSTEVCLSVLEATNKEGGVGMKEVIEETGLSENDAARYVVFLNGLGLLAYLWGARSKRLPAWYALRKHRDFIRWSGFFGPRRASGD